MHGSEDPGRRRKILLSIASNVCKGLERFLCLPSPQKAGRKVFPSFVCDLVGLIDAAFDQDVNGVSRLVFQPGSEY